MKQSDAAKILGLSGDVTPETIKAAYRQAAMTYHPDINPAGAEMMKLINAAYDVLKDYTGHLGQASEETVSYPEAVSQALNAILGLSGLIIEICGSWVWVSGETYPHRKALKEAGFQFAPQKKSWYFRPEDWKSASRGSSSMDEIRERYGSTSPAFRRDLLSDNAA